MKKIQYLICTILISCAINIHSESPFFHNNLMYILKHCNEQAQDNPFYRNPVDFLACIRTGIKTQTTCVQTTEFTFADPDFPRCYGIVDDLRDTELMKDEPNIEQVRLQLLTQMNDVQEDMKSIKKILKQTPPYCDREKLEKEISSIYKQIEELNNSISLLTAANPQNDDTIRAISQLQTKKDSLEKDCDNIEKKYFDLRHQFERGDDLQILRQLLCELNTSMRILNKK